MVILLGVPLGIAFPSLSLTLKIAVGTCEQGAVGMLSKLKAWSHGHSLLGHVECWCGSLTRRCEDVYFQL